MTANEALALSARKQKSEDNWRATREARLQYRARVKVVLEAQDVDRRETRAAKRRLGRPDEEGDLRREWMLEALNDKPQRLN